MSTNDVRQWLRDRADEMEAEHQHLWVTALGGAEEWCVTCLTRRRADRQEQGR